MKYMILLFGDQNTMMEVKTPEWIREMIKFMQTIDQELKDTGEYVDGQGLVDPSQAKTVRFVEGAPVPTDGPFAEAKASVAGYRILAPTQAPAHELASRIVAFVEEPVEVRQVADAPPEV
jgi:hypothetical protein